MATNVITTPEGVTLRVSARTGLAGLSEKTRAAIAAMAQAAPAAGIAVIDITAGKERGHLSHGQGTEVDLKGYTVDGQLWSPEQRVAIAGGAQTAGADRFGFYSRGGLGASSLHVGFSGPNRPAAVWGYKGRVRGENSRAFTNPAELAFLATFKAGGVYELDEPDPFGIAGFQAQQAAPQDAQGAIAGLLAPSGGSLVQGPPTAAFGYAPNLPDDASFPTSAPTQVSTQAPRPPTLPPLWASDGAFPPMPQGTGAPPPGMVPDPSMRPGALSPVRPAMPSAMDMGVGNLPPMPPARPERGLGIPNPPPRALGIPNPTPRPDITDPSLSFNRQSGRGPDERGFGPPLPPEEQARIREELATLDHRIAPPVNAVRPEFPGSLPAAPPSYVSPVAGRPDVPIGSMPGAPPYVSPVAGRPDVPVGSLPAGRRELGLSYEPQPVMDAYKSGRPTVGPDPLELEIAEGQRRLDAALAQQAETERRQAIPPPTSGPADQYLGLPAGTYPRPPAQESYTPMTGVMPQVREPAGFGPSGLPQTSQIRGLPSLNTAAFPQGMEPNFLTDLGIFDEAAVPGRLPETLSFDAMPSGPPYTQPPASGPSAGLSSPQVPPAPPALSWVQRNFYTGDPANLSAAPPAPPPPDTSPYGGLRSMADMWGVTMGSEAPQPTVSLSPGLSAPSWAERQAADAGTSTTGQSGINSVFGAPQAEAAPPNLAIPYAEVPGYSAAYDPRTATPGRPNQLTQAPSQPPMSYTPMVGPIDAYSAAENAKSEFGGGSVVASGVSMVDPSTYGQPGPMSANTGLVEAVAAPSEAATTVAQELPTADSSVKDPAATAAEQSKVAQFVRSLLPPIFGSGQGRGILGGNGGLLGGMFAQPTYNWNGASGTSPMGIDYRTGIQTGLNRSGNSLLGPGSAMQWNTTDGNRSVTVSQDPWTGTYYQPTYGAPI